MNSFFRRTVRGYLTIFRGTAALAAALVTLAAVSVAITDPESGRVIGSITVGIDVDELTCRGT